MPNQVQMYLTSTSVLDHLDDFGEISNQQGFMAYQETRDQDKNKSWCILI